MADNKLSRRTILKSSGTALTLSGVNLLNVSTAKADQTQSYIGKKKLLEFKVEHDLPDRIEKSVSCGLPSYISDRDNEIVGLLQPNSLPSENDELLISNRNHLHSDRIEQKENKRILEEWGYQGGSAVYTELEDEYRPPTAEFRTEILRQDQQMNGSSRVELAIDGDTYSIESGETIVERLSSQEVTVKYISDEREPIEVESRHGEGTYTIYRKTTSEKSVIEVVPILKARYHGKVDVYGEREKLIIPTNTKNPYASSLISSVKENGREVNKSDDLLIVSKGGGE